MRKVLTALSVTAVAASLGGCMTTPPPAEGMLIDFNGHMVTIQGRDGWFPDPTPEMEIHAADICNGPVRYASTKQGSIYLAYGVTMPYYQHRFLCEDT